jgi:hypothetical protein
VPVRLFLDMVGIEITCGPTRSKPAVEAASRLIEPTVGRGEADAALPMSAEGRLRFMFCVQAADAMLESAETFAPSPIEEEAQFEKGSANDNPRISTESAGSGKSNIIDGVSRVSISSEGSKDSDSHVVCLSFTPR